MKILNLGCGTKACISNEVVNIDWSVYLYIKNHHLLKLIIPLVLNNTRLDKINSLPDNIMVHNLAEGIPFENNSIDAVYHSHVLEHLDCHIAKSFLREIHRVLKPSGIHRIVVPDFEKSCRDYLAHILQCENNSQEIDRHDAYIAEIIEQSVRRESFGTSQQKPLRRFIENKILGDARKRGETHQWMYDRINLKSLLIDVGFKNINIETYNTSSIPNWNSYALDLDKDGNQYKPDSLYMEAIK